MLRKNPPKRRKGIMRGGPMDNAIDTLLEMHDTMYPKNEICCKSVVS